MPDRKLAELIAGRMQSGLIWPGDPARELPAKPIAIPAFRTGGGLPQEMVDLVNESTIMIAEAIVHLIETDGQKALVPRDRAYQWDAREARAAAGGELEARKVPVHCRCDRDLRDPLMVLTVDDSPRIVVNGSQLIKGLSQRSEKCPHPATPR